MYNDDYDEDNDEGVGFEFAGDDDNDSVDREGDVFENVFQNDNQIQNSDGKTFEELCRLHLKEFAKGAEQFAVETQLSKRVSNWQNNLEKVLAEEEDRPEFNIQTYGSRIIQNAETCIRQQKKRGFQRMSSGGNDEEENLVRILYILFK
jgi:condensin-2 complex subunit H2